MNTSESNLSAILTKIPAAYLQSNFDQNFFEQELSNLLNISELNTNTTPIHTVPTAVNLKVPQNSSKSQNDKSPQNDQNTLSNLP